MKQMFSTLIIGAAMTGIATYAEAKTLNVVVGNVTYAIPSSQAGDMNYANGSTLTIMGKTINVSDITRMYVDNSEVEDNTVSVSYNGTSATVTVAGNVAQYVTPTVSGAHVSITQDDAVSDQTCGEIIYALTGTAEDGEFAMNGSYKASIELRGVSLTNPSGAPLDIQNGKRISLSIKKDTENTLTDATGGSQKGCIVCKGHLELKGKGVLNVYGNTAHAVYAKEYVEMKNCTLNVLSAVKDGVNCNQYFFLESGALNISGVQDDGVQVSYKDDTDREAEDTGTITIAGGSVNIAVTGTATKGLKADGDVIVSDGDITVVTSGGMYAYVNGREYTDYTGNTDYLDSDQKSSPKGIKADGNVTINGGNIRVTTTGNGAEGIESKEVLTINNGTIVVNSCDDAINSSSHMYINGGDVTVVATDNDGLDSNGNLYISGGVIRAFGTSSPECGIDANEEEGYSVIFTGGTLLAVGGGNSVPRTSESTQPYVSGSMSVSAGNEITLKSGDTVLATFTVPDNYSSSNQGGGPGGWGAPANAGPGGGGPGGGGWGGSSVLISCAGLTSGSSYTMTSGTSSSTVTATITGNGGGGRPW